MPRDLPSGNTGRASPPTWTGSARCYEARWGVVAWPERYGGRDATLWEWLIFEEEYYRAGGAAPGHPERHLPARAHPVRVRHAEQQDRILPRMAAAQDLWCQGWSEPGAGSDLAGDHAAAPCVTRQAGAGCCPGRRPGPPAGRSARTCSGCSAPIPAAERHRGLTYFLVPLDAPGVTVRGFARLDGDEEFAEVFFDSAFVPDSDVLGEVNQGWRVAMATTGSERGLDASVRPGASCATRTGCSSCTAPGPPPPCGTRWSRRWIDAQAYHLFTVQQVTAITDGARPGAESSLNKLFWSELDVRLHETALALLGEDGELDAPWAGVRVLPGRSDLRGHQRGAAQRRGRATARPAEELGTAHALHDE